MTTATIGPVELTGAYAVSDDGGMQSPDMAVDKDFDYSSYVQRQPVEASVSAVVGVEDELATLRTLREQKQPVGFEAGQIAIETVTIENVSVEQEATRKSHVEASIDVVEVFTAEVETTDAVVELPSAGGGGGTVSGGGSELPSLVDTSSDSEGGSGPPSSNQSPTSGGGGSATDTGGGGGGDGGGGGGGDGGGGGLLDGVVSAASSAVDSVANGLANVTPGEGII